MTTVSIYTDGSSRGNPGPGGYGVLLVSHTGRRKEFSAGFAETTNNRMEVMAAAVGLEALKKPCKVRLYSDSQYLINAMTKGWVTSWQARGWVKSDKKPVKNTDLWKRLLAAAQGHQIGWHWVKGHAGHSENERCDFLATEAALGSKLPEDPGYGG